MKLNHFVIGTNDMDAATSFYESLFEGTAITHLFATDRMTYWQGDGFTFALAIPFDQQPARHGNGTMLAFQLASAEDVAARHRRVIELGGVSEGEPGPRGPRFSAYVRDLDHNKICFYV